MVRLDRTIQKRLRPLKDEFIMNMETIRQKAKNLLTGGRVAMIVGYEIGSTANRRRPAFAKSPAEIDRFVLDGYCEENLATYLVRSELLQSMNGGKIAIFLSLAGIRSINLLSAESQVNPDNVIILGFELSTSGKLDSEIKILPGEHVTDHADRIAQLKSSGFQNDRSKLIEKIENMTADERMIFWRDQFSKCIKCYACRQVCPACYCRRCIVDCNQPQWVSTSSHELGNMEWNLVRAFHLAGRCVGCGNCERACPAGIPLMLLNQRLGREVLKEFDHFAGTSPTQEPLLATFDKNDSDTFIL
jgi:ferredoxin